MKRYGNYGRKVSWIVKRFGKCRRKQWKDKENMKKCSWIVKWFGKYEEK